jgi:hypothetical protein
MSRFARPERVTFSRVVAVLVAGLTSGAAHPAYGESRCSCLAAHEVEQAVTAADAVFLAHVRDVADEPLDASLNSVGAGRLVRLEVIANWKGGLSGVVVLRTGSSDADCGVAFEPGMTYLVYATDAPPGLHASICSRTRHVRDAVDDLITLGLPSPPVDRRG